MPYHAEHSARINEPGKYKSIKRDNDKFGPGVDVIWGIQDKGPVEIQAIRFKSDKFTVKEAKEWLDKHPEFKVIKFEPAIDKPTKINLAEFEELFDDHTISSVERKRWWGSKRTEFYVYTPKVLVVFKEPLPHKYKQGTQSFIRKIEFI